MESKDIPCFPSFFYLFDAYHSFTSLVMSDPPTLYQSSTNLSKSSKGTAPIMIFTNVSFSKASNVDFLSAIVSVGEPANASYMKDRKSTRLNSSHVKISYAVFCLKKKKKMNLKN